MPSVRPSQGSDDGGRGCFERLVPGPAGNRGKQTASQTSELTALWFLGAEKRDALLVREPPITPWKPAPQGPRFDALLDVNRDPSGPAIHPARVTPRVFHWSPAEE